MSALAWKLDVTQSLIGLEFTFKNLKAKLLAAVDYHNGRLPEAIIINEQQQRYVSSGLGNVPWKTYKHIPLEMVK